MLYRTIRALQNHGEISTENTSGLRLKIYLLRQTKITIIALNQSSKYSSLKYYLLPMISSIEKKRPDLTGIYEQIVKMHNAIIDSDFIESERKELLNQNLISNDKTSHRLIPFFQNPDISSFDDFSSKKRITGTTN